MRFSNCTSESLIRLEDSFQNQLHDPDLEDKDDFGALPYNIPIKMDPDKEGVFIKKEFYPPQNFPELTEENSPDRSEKSSLSYSKVNRVDFLFI